MPKAVRKHEYESFESLLNRFRRLVDKADTLNDFYKHEAYEKPSTKKGRLRAAAVKREQRRVREENANRTMV